MTVEDDLRYELHLLKRKLDVAVHYLANALEMDDKEDLVADIEEEAKRGAQYFDKKFWTGALQSVCDDDSWVNCPVEVIQVSVHKSPNGFDLPEVSLTAFIDGLVWDVKGTYDPSTSLAKVENVSCHTS